MQLLICVSLIRDREIISIWFQARFGIDVSDFEDGNKSNFTVSGSIFDEMDAPLAEQQKYERVYNAVFNDYW